MLLRLGNKTYSAEPAPTPEALSAAMDEAYEYCGLLGREVSHCPKLNDYNNIAKFLSDCFYYTGNKLQAIKRLGSSFRNESLSIQRDTIEIMVDSAWIWHHFEFRHSPQIADRICSQFYMNSPAKFISEFPFIKKLYPRDPFVRAYFTETSLESHFEKTKKRVGNYCYQKNWRHLKGVFPSKECQWKARSDKAGQVMERVAGLKNADFYRNLSVLSGYTHWDSFQTQISEDALEKAFYNRNLNATIGMVHDLIQLGFHILDRGIPKRLATLRQRIIW